MVKAKENLVGKIFGKLTVLNRVIGKTDKTGNAYWRCLCDCGKEHIVSDYAFKNSSITRDKFETIEGYSLNYNVNKYAFG